jgi:hypothetical protein
MVSPVAATVIAAARTACAAAAVSGNACRRPVDQCHRHEDRREGGIGGDHDGQQRGDGEQADADFDREGGDGPQLGLHLPGLVDEGLAVVAVPGFGVHGVDLVLEGLGGGDVLLRELEPVGADHHDLAGVALVHVDDTGDLRAGGAEGEGGQDDFDRRGRGHDGEGVHHALEGFGFGCAD